VASTVANEIILFRTGKEIPDRAAVHHDRPFQPNHQRPITRVMKQIANIYYEIADTPEMILPRNNFVTTYIWARLYRSSLSRKIIPNKSDDKAIYFVA
jgi:hypothetical protein